MVEVARGPVVAEPGGFVVVERGDVVELVVGVVVVGMPLAWVVLGFGCYPLFVVLGLVYMRAAARNERAFTDVLEGP